MGNAESQPADHAQRDAGDVDEEEPQQEQQEQLEQEYDEQNAAVQRMNEAMEKQEPADATLQSSKQPQAAVTTKATQQEQGQAVPTTQPKPTQDTQIAATEKAAPASVQLQPLSPPSKPLSPLRQPLPPPQQPPEAVALTSLKAAAAAPAAASPAKAPVAANPVGPVAVVSPSVPSRPPPGATTEAEDDHPPEGSPEPPARVVSTRSGVGEEHLDLWYALVEWVSEARVLDTGVVLAWDSEEVGARVLALTTDKRLMDTLTLKQAERKRARIAALRAEQAKKRGEGSEAAPHELQPLSAPAAASASSASSSSSSSASKHVLPPLPDGVSIPYALAEELLVLDRSLAALRHTWVPSRVSEDTFWAVYFSAVLQTIRDHVLSLQQPEEQLQDTNPALEEIIRKQMEKELER